MKIELSIIIVNFNGQKFFQDCLTSLFDKLNLISHEIIVFDNNSTDESCAFIKKKFPKVVLIESKINYGFGKGNNEAVKKAKGEHLLLINNDTIVLDNLLPVLNILKSDKSIGVVGINMLNGDKKYIPAAGVFPNFFNLFHLKKMLQINDEFISGKFSKKNYEVDWLGGSFLMLSTKLYNEISGFDQDYFMYVEDIDFCKKIAIKGYKRVLLTNFNYIHFVGFTKEKNPMLIKGFKIYISKHCKGFNKTACQIALQINSTVKKIKKYLNL